MLPSESLLCSLVARDLLGDPFSLVLGRRLASVGTSTDFTVHASHTVNVHHHFDLPVCSEYLLLKLGAY